MHSQTCGLHKRPSAQVKRHIGERLEASGSNSEQNALPFASVAGRESEQDLAFGGLHQTIGSINWHEVLSNALLCRLGP
jgi:hypothetical protein